jgi:hypothetical protein
MCVALLKAAFMFNVEERPLLLWSSVLLYLFLVAGFPDKPPTTLPLRPAPYQIARENWLLGDET